MRTINMWQPTFDSCSWCMKTWQLTDVMTVEVEHFNRLYCTHHISTNFNRTLRHSTWHDMRPSELFKVYLLDNVCSDNNRRGSIIFWQLMAMGQRQQQQHQLIKTFDSLWHNLLFSSALCIGPGQSTASISSLTARRLSIIMNKIVILAVKLLQYSSNKCQNIHPRCSQGQGRRTVKMSCGTCQSLESFSDANSSHWSDVQPSLYFQTHIWSFTRLLKL